MNRAQLHLPTLGYAAIGLALLFVPEISLAQEFLGINKLLPLYEVINSTTASSNRELWEFFRSLVNWVLVAVLMVAAFAQVFRLNIDTYGIKKVLPNLIIGFILANFSLFICSTLIQLADSLTLTAQSLVTQATGQPIEWAYTSGNYSILIGGLIALIAASSIFGGGLGVILALVVTGILLLAPMIAAFVLALMFIVRYYVVQYLVVLSPVAFIAMAVPLSQKLFQQWWKLLTTWIFMKPVGWFILGLGGIIVQADVGGDLIAYIIGILALIGSVTLPFSMGGKIMSTIANLAGKLGSTAGQRGFTRFMNSDWARKKPLGQFLADKAGRLAYGYEDFKEQEKRNASRARTYGYGKAIDARLNREMMAAERSRIGLGKPGMYLASYFSGPKYLGLKPSDRGYRGTLAAEEAEVEKHLPMKDYEALRQVLYQSQDKTERAVALRGIAAMGKDYQFTEDSNKRIAYLEEQLAANPNDQAAALELSRIRSNLGLMENERIDYSNSSVMQRMFAALLSDAGEQKKIQAELAKSSSALEAAAKEEEAAAKRSEEAAQAAAEGRDKDRQNLEAQAARHRSEAQELRQQANDNAAIKVLEHNQIAMDQLNRLSSQLFFEGNMHLGSFVSKDQDGKMRMNTNAQDRASQNVTLALAALEPQKLATTLSTSAAFYGDPSEGKMTDFLKELTSREDFRRVVPQAERFKGGIQVGLVAAARQETISNKENRDAILSKLDKSEKK